MQFRTELKIQKAATSIKHNKHVMFIGSCFTENIGQKCKQIGLPVQINPFGVIYNPVSVLNSLRFVLEGRLFAEDDLFEANEKWNSFYHHSRFSAHSKKETLARINKEISRANNNLRSASHLFITFGTAYVFQHLQENMIVSNNHKLPASEFMRYRLSVPEIVEAYQVLLADLYRFNPGLSVVFTVSPVRHMKDGAHGNQISKSTLLLAIEELQQIFQNTGYFPAYEIFMDDLRDYRFYDEDLNHPNAMGVQYVWEKFQEAYIEPDTMALARSVEKIYKAMQHKVQNKQSESFRLFALRYETQIRTLCEAHPYLQLQDALDYFSLD